MYQNLLSIFFTKAEWTQPLPLLNQWKMEGYFKS